MLERRSARRVRSGVWILKKERGGGVLLLRDGVRYETEESCAS